MLRVAGLLLLDVVLAGLAFAACSSESGAGSGAGGASSLASSTAARGSGSTGTGVPDSGPVTCSGTYATIPKGSCDLLAQDCPIGSTCFPDATGTTTQCQPGSGLKGPGENCDFAEECRAGLFCIGPVGQSQCTLVCCPDTNEPCGGGTCNVEVQFGSGPTPPYVEMCAFSEQCKLLTPNACAPGYDCHIEDPSQGLATCGAPSSTVVDELETCTYLNDCHDMQECLHGGTDPTGTCHWYCYLDLQTPASPGLGGCPSGESCVDHIGNLGIDFGVPNVGVCNPTTDGG